MTANLLSFDIENWFHSHNLWDGLERTEWDSYESHVISNTKKILDLLDEYNHQATFFVLGYTAERAPELVREISERGHEVASHGYGHDLLYDMSEKEIREDIQHSLEVLEPHTRSDIVGYRAPSFSIKSEAIEILADLGFEYDSSSVPFKKHDRYGSIGVESDTTVTSIDHGLQEIQMPLLEFGPFGIPWGGGGYFRFIPYPVFSRGIRRIKKNQDFVFYFHPWELDTEQPVVQGIKHRHRIRHYYNINKTEQRLKKLLRDFEWQPVRDRL